MLTIQTGKNLSREKAKIVELEEGRKIAAILLEEMKQRNDAIGLAAPQIDIDAAVAIVDVKESIVLINPKITSLEGNLFSYKESCLSFPGISQRTLRYATCVVESDNVEGAMYFGPSDETDSLGLLESICVQHEIAHLNGLTIFDFAKPNLKSTKIGRNEKVTIQKNGVEQTLKYKKAESYLNDGWELDK